MSDLHASRPDYDSEGIDAATMSAAPWDEISVWVSEAIGAAQASPGLFEPTAVSVATVDGAGMPNVRTVLARFLDDRGPGFVSSRHSAKAVELAGNPHIALAYTWPAIFRAIRFRGVAESIPPEELRAYWQTRPYGSQIAASASRQSHPIESRAALEAEFTRWQARYPEGAESVPMPEDFCGWRVHCEEVEFWAGRRSRLHDRIVYARSGPGTLADPAAWEMTRRQP